MVIHIELSSALAKYNKGDRLEVEAKEQILAYDAASLYGLPQEEIGIIVKDGKKISFDHLLVNNDRITIYPPIIGG